MDTVQKKELYRSHLKALTVFDANNKCMSPEECAKFLGVSYKTVLNRIEAKKIYANKIGKIYRIPKMQFVEIIVTKIISDGY